MAFLLHARQDDPRYPSSPNFDPAWCTQETCDPIWSIYGYRPSLPPTYVFLFIFAVSALAYAVQGWFYRTRWLFTFAMVAGGLAEVIGYVAKTLLNDDPFSDLGFKMSIVMLTMAPAFYAAGIYWTLKHFANTFSPTLSRLDPKWYPRLFISCDLVSIILQAAGGGLSSAATNDAALDAGTNVMIAGLAFQVITLFAFGLVAGEYMLRCWRHRSHLNPATRSMRATRRFKGFVVAMWVAYTGIQIRCCYRVAELAGGWTNNAILRDEALFYGMDGAVVALAAVVLNCWHPGWCLPHVVGRGRRGKGGSSSPESHEEAVEVKGAEVVGQ